ncbi:MAG: 6,7-dimethyl-8-ribityllumazine synthase [Mariniphaga sp.]|nr:6,7-dimethyl-8-ribityllumazine synthase [Mariniphaga sp.]
MATKDLSDYDIATVPSAKKMRFGIVVSEWNIEVTGALANGAVKTLLKHGAKEENIKVHYVPGSFELPLGGQFLAKAGGFDAIILLGCVIQGETKHFDFICQGVTKGTVDLNLKYNLPFIFGVLTTKTMEQAIARSGGKHGNKGNEAAVTAIKMVSLSRNL